jgi:hypothetical protein
MQNYPRKLCHVIGWNENMKSKLYWIQGITQTQQQCT